MLLTGYGITSKLKIDPKTGVQTYDSGISRFLKEVEYKDTSDQVEKCSNDSGIICADSKIKGERYCQSN